MSCVVTSGYKRLPYKHRILSWSCVNPSFSPVCNSGARPPIMFRRVKLRLPVISSSVLFIL